jgi:hypothetical protein
MAKGKRTKRQTMIYHVLHIKLKIEEVEFFVESDNWETYDEKISLRSNTLCLELDVNTEIFNTEQEMLSELGHDHMT